MSKLTSEERKNINSWCDQIIEEHFATLPKWINRDVFYSTFRDAIIQDLFSLCELGETEIDLNRILAVPLASRHINDIFSLGVGLNEYERYEIPEWIHDISKELPKREIDEKSSDDPVVVKLRQLLEQKGVDADQFTYNVSTYEKSLVLIGDTKPFKDVIKEVGGKWNSNLSCGPGWIFPKKALLNRK